MFGTRQEIDGVGVAVEAGYTILEVWEHEWSTYKREGGELKHSRHEHNPLLEQGKSFVPEDGEPAGEHTHGGGCLVCSAARIEACSASS